ncbi:hypothetical protein M407DRAFT_80916, partial [Tulasnella calospora MUT 4182]
ILCQLKQWTSLKHPSVLPFVGYQWQDEPILIFPHFENGNILHYLKVNPHADRLKLLAQIAQGLSFLHSESIIHGSVKPSNVIISDEGSAMLMDFGMAPDLRVAERHITRALLDQDLVGYMSPELVEDQVFTAASDVYSYGALTLHVGGSNAGNRYVSDSRRLRIDHIRIPAVSQVLLRAYSERN